MELMKKNSRFTFPTITAITVLVIIFVYKFISLPQIVCSDEGDYIWTGNVVFEAVKSGKWATFKQLTYSQFHYPFFQSWYLAFATLPFNYSVASSRLVSLLLLLPTVILVWLIAKKINQRLWSTVLPVGLVLTSPLSLFYFSNVMKEGLATVLTLVTFFIYFRAREKKSLILFLMVSALTLTLTLTKYNYGALVLLALGLESIIWFWQDKNQLKKDFWLNNFRLYLPFLIGFSFWLFYPVNRFGYLFPFPQSKDVFNLKQATLLGHLLYYPRELAFSYTFSWLAFLILTLGFIWSLKDWRDYKVRTLAGYFLINLFLAEKHIINNQARYIFTSVPVFFLIGSYGLEQIISLINKTKKTSFILGIILPFLIAGSLILIRDLTTFPKMISRTGSHQIQSAIFYEQDFQDISMFNFNRNLWPKIPPPENYESFQNVMNFVLANVDLRKNISLVGGLNEFNRGIFDFYIDKAREEKLIVPLGQYQNYFVILQVKENSRFDNFDYRVFGQLRSYQASQQVLADKSSKKLAEKYFPYLGLTVTISGR